MLLTLAEVCVLLNERDQAIASAEAAYEIQPLNSDTRNLLLSLAPATWKDKVRSAPPVEVSYSTDLSSPSRGAVPHDASAPTDDEDSESRPSEARANSDRSKDTVARSNELLRVRAIQREGEGLSDRDAIANLIGGSWLIKITPRAKGREKVGSMCFNNIAVLLSYNFCSFVCSPLQRAILRSPRKLQAQRKLPVL